MSSINRFCWSLAAMFLSLTLCAVASGQDDFFGDATTTEDDGGFEDSGFEDPEAPPEVDPEVAQQEVDAALEQIHAAQEAEDWENALTLIDELRKKYPGATLLCMYEAGRCYAGSGNDNQAKRMFSDILAQPGAMGMPQILSGTSVEIGKLEMDSGNYLDAIDYFSDAMQTMPSNPEAHYYFGRATFLQVITSPGGTNDPTSAAGLRSAMKSISKALELKPDYGEAYLDRGRILTRLRNVKLAVEDHEKSVQYLGDDSSAMGDLGLTYRSSGRSEAAKKDFDQNKVLADYRRSLQAMDTYLKNHNINDSTKPWDDVDPLDPQPHAILLARAELKIDIGNEEGSESQYQGAIADTDTYIALEHIGPGEKAQGHFTRGLALRMLNRFEEAKTEFTKSIEQAKQSRQQGFVGQPYLRRGIVHFRQGNYDLALQDFNDATYSTSPIQADPRAKLWIGLCHAKQGDMHAATEAYTTAIGAYRDFLPAYMNRGLAHMKTGRFSDAFDDFTMVLRLDADNANAKTYREAAKRQLDEGSLTASSY
ncbi:tetratricopeptide repeat protein [Planctomycetota bacterium]